MVPVNTELVNQAHSIFDQLGYTVVGDGPEFRAERGWKVVRVTATENGSDVPSDGTLRCFVTPRANATTLRRQLRDDDPEYEWAVISVDGEDYEVERAPPGPRPSALT